MDTRRYAKRQLTWFRNQMHGLALGSGRRGQEVLEKQLASG